MKPDIYKWAQKIAHKIAVKNKKKFKTQHWIFTDYINQIGDVDEEDLESWAWMMDGDY